MNEPMTISEIIEAGEAESRRMAEVFRYDPRNETLTINVVYEYEVDLDRIRTPADLLEWTHHLAEKNWITTAVLAEFIERVFTIKGWERAWC